MLDKRYDTPQALSPDPAEPYVEASCYCHEHVNQITICNSGDEAERCSMWLVNACGTFFFFPPLRHESDLTMQPSQGNLGQALSLLIKKGIFFCHPLGEEHGG